MKRISGILFDIRRFAIHDGPGIRTAVFFKGCPLDCWWCHNPESQNADPELILHPARCTQCGACLDACESGASSLYEGEIRIEWKECTTCGRCVDACVAEGRRIVGRAYDIQEVMGLLERDRDFYEQSGGGVTFTGGEPLLQAGFLLKLLKACKAAGFHTVLDTSGFASWKALDEVSKLVDLFLYDLKLMDEARHLAFTGVSNKQILDNLEKLSLAGHPIWLRIPIIPGVNDDLDNLRATASLANRLSGIEQINLLPYHASAEIKYNHLGRSYRLPALTTPSCERMDEIANILRNCSLPVVIGG